MYVLAIRKTLYFILLILTLSIWRQEMIKRVKLKTTEFEELSSLI